MRLGLDVPVQPTEENIVRHRLTDFQRTVTLCGIATANNQLRRKFLHSLGDRLGIAGHMQPIGAYTACNTAVASNQRRGSGFLNDRNKRSSAFLELGIVMLVLRHDNSCHIAAAKGLRKFLLRFACISSVRYDQYKAATVLDGCHCSFPVVRSAPKAKSRHNLITARLHPANPINLAGPGINSPSGHRIMTPDLYFYAAAIPAVVLVGLSKGGLGGALALMGVPLMALAVSPVRAAAIFLPILIVMDIIALWSWRHYNDRRTLLLLLPGAMAGIALGWATSALIPANAMRIVLAIVTILFVLRYFIDASRAGKGTETAPKPHRPALAGLWSSLSGYASFVAHAGGPPFQIYVLPLRLDPKIYTGTSVRFFAIMNAVKLIPYFALGQLDTENLSLSAILLPVAIISTIAGARIVHYIRPAIFYPLMYVMALLAALKLLWDGLAF